MTLEEKRSLTIAGTLFAVVMIAILVLVPYVRKWRFYDQTIAERQVRIKSLKRQIANKPALLQEITQLKQVLGDSGLLIKASDKQVAESQLLALIKKLIEEAGGQINSINTQSTKAEAEKIVAVRLNCFFNNESLIDTLRLLAESKPLLNVTNLQLVPMQRRQGATVTDMGRVRVDMTIEAFYADLLSIQPATESPTYSLSGFRARSLTEPSINPVPSVGGYDKGDNPIDPSQLISYRDANQGVWQ